MHYPHDGDLKDYRAENGFQLLTENEAIGILALLFFLVGLFPELLQKIL